jgi:LmbE family N-acetylglucosaminyl deacetylase
MNVLLLLAHADDEALGTGGIVQHLVAGDHDIQLLIVSDGVVGMRSNGEGDNRRALRASCEILGIDNWSCLDFPDQRFDTHPVAEIANWVQDEMELPDLIVTHASSDLNRDHRITAEVAKIIGRPRGRPVSILACEIPMVSPWNGRPFDPNFFVELTEEQLKKKIAAFTSYENEIREFPDPYSEEGLRNLARFRGQQSGHRAAEAFRVVRWNL